MVEIQIGRRYVITTSLGRKLVWVVDMAGPRVRIRKLRSASLRYTEPQWVTLEWLQNAACRLPGDGDIDLLRRGTRARNRKE